MAKVFHSLITSIDIGTTKISVLIAQKLSDDQVEVIGIGQAKSDGLDKGVVVDIARTVSSIKQAVKEAELMAGCSVTDAYIGISGAHIQSFNSHGAVPIKKFQVQDADIKDVLASAQAVSLEEGQKILHTLPQYFTVDGKDRVTNPLGLHGVRLEAVVHVITGSVASIQNLIKCCELAGVGVKDIVLEQLASAAGVLSQDERELGVGVLDIGGGTSDFAVYQQGSIRFTKVLPIAGNHFTKDMAVGLHATLRDAERFKRMHGYVGFMAQDDEELEIESVHGNVNHKVSKKQAGYILHVRALELLVLVQEEMKRSNLTPMMTSGLVITGGGSLLQGIEEIAQKILGIPVRIGNPMGELGLSEALRSPIHATGYGLLQYAVRKNHQLGMNQMSGPMVKRILSKMRSWVDKFF